MYRLHDGFSILGEGETIKMAIADAMKNSSRDDGAPVTLDWIKRQLALAANPKRRGQGLMMDEVIPEHLIDSLIERYDLEDAGDVDYIRDDPNFGPGAIQCRTGRGRIFAGYEGDLVRELWAKMAA